MKAFWMLLGALGAAAVFGLVLRAREEPRLPVYVVVIESLCIAGFLFGAAFALTSWAEGERQAAVRALAVFALPWVIAGLIFWSLGKKSTGERSDPGSADSPVAEDRSDGR